MPNNSRGFAAIFLLLVGFAVFIVIAITLYTNLLSDNPALDYLTSPETKNLAAPPPTEKVDIENLPTTSTSPPDSTDSKGLRCVTSDDCKSLSYCTDGEPKICYIGKCLVKTCVVEKIFY